LETLGYFRMSLAGRHCGGVSCGFSSFDRKSSPARRDNDAATAFLMRLLMHVADSDATATKILDALRRFESVYRRLASRWGAVKRKITSLRLLTGLRPTSFWSGRYCFIA
jgi:hypothetical protein